MALSAYLPKSVLKCLVVNYAVKLTPSNVTTHFSTAKIPESLKALYEKKVEQMELRKKKLDEKKKKWIRFKFRRHEKINSSLPRGSTTYFREVTRNYAIQAIIQAIGEQEKIGVATPAG
ncbi:hypothetical protein PCYB_072040, partial [Plasmodium cynomolgi strain B]